MTLLSRPERFRRVIETSLHSCTGKFPLFLVSFFPFFLPSYIVPLQKTFSFLLYCHPEELVLRYTRAPFPYNPVIYQCNHFVVNILFSHVSFNNRLQDKFNRKINRTFDFRLPNLRKRSVY
jgi:hypothetical protein